MNHKDVVNKSVQRLLTRYGLTLEDIRADYREGEDKAKSAEQKKLYAKVCTFHYMLRWESPNLMGNKEQGVYFGIGEGTVSLRVNQHEKRKK